MRRVGRDVNGLAGTNDRVLAAEGDLNFAFENGEHLFEIVAMGCGAAAGRDMHVDETFPE
jgi:hypothetical protein